MSTTTAERRRRRRDRMGVFWGIAVAVNLVALVPFLVWDELRRSDFVVEPKTEEELLAERKRREELAKRPKEEIPKEQVEQAREHIERRKRAVLKEKVEELIRLKEEIAELKDEQLAVVEERDEADFLDQLVEAVREQAKELARRSEDLQRRDQREEARHLRDQAQHLQREAEQLRPPTEQADGSKVLSDPARATVVAEAARAVAETSSAYAETEPSPQARDVADRAERLAARAASLAGQDATAALDGFSSDQAPLAADLEALPTSELYEQARALDQQIAEQAADHRAAELALTQDTSFQHALQAVATPTAQAADLAQALSQDPQNRAELSAFGEALDQAIAQADNAAERARSQLSQAQGRQAGRDGGERQLDLGQAQAAAALSGALGQASLHQEGSRGVMVDLTGLMAQAYGNQAAESGIRAGSNQAEGGSAMTEGVRRSQLNLDAHRIRAQALPGRKFSRASQRTGWLFIDSWYVVGPFENRGRIDFNQRNPPEGAIDLDAEYVGKGGRRLTWNYLQSNVMRINPPDEQSDSTYYGFTEVWFEEATDMLLAVASDDAAKVWINDIVVWQDTGLSAWQLDEGFRKVRFKQGFNTILVRIENGPVVCYYSLLLCPSDL